SSRFPTAIHILSTLFPHEGYQACATSSRNLSFVQVVRFRDPSLASPRVLLPSVANSQHVNCNGNWVSHRDSADSRVISQYKNRGSGGFWPNGVVDAGSFAI